MRRPYSLLRDTYRDSNPRPNAFSLIAHHAKDIKLSLLQQYTESLLATATLMLPSHSTSEDIFLPDGQINTRALFATGPPLFNAWGEYSAQVQLIFSKTSSPVERDVSIVLESSMLFVDEETSGLLSSTLESNSQTNNNMNVLFSTTHTAPLHLTPVNEEFHKRRLSQFYSFCLVRWVQECLHLCKRALRFCFIVPIKTYEAFHRYLRQSSQMIFPLIDESKEMALTLPVYQHFTPPISLQSRLRAMNFTCYYVVHEETEMNELWQTSPNTKHYHHYSHKNSNEIRSTSSLQLRRILLHSSLRLHGLARFFMMYPIFSFIVCTIVCFATCVAVMNVMLVGLGLFVYVKLIRKGQSHKQEHKGKKNKKRNKSSKLYKNRWSRNDDSDSDKYNYSSTDGNSSTNNDDDSGWSNVIWTDNNDDSFSPSDSVINNNDNKNDNKKKTKHNKKQNKRNKHIARFLLSHTDSFPQATSYNELARLSSSSSASSTSSSSSETETSKATLIPVDDTSLSIGQHTSDNNKNIHEHKNTNDSSHVHTNDEKEQESRQEKQQKEEEQENEEKKEENAETQSTFLSARELTTPLSPSSSPSSPFYTNAKLTEEHEKEKEMESEAHKTQQTKTNVTSNTTSTHSAIDKERKDTEDDKKKGNNVKDEGNTNKDNKDHGNGGSSSSDSSFSSNENMYDKVH